MAIATSVRIKTLANIVRSQALGKMGDINRRNLGLPDDQKTSITEMIPSIIEDAREYYARLLVNNNIVGAPELDTAALETEIKQYLGQHTPEHDAVKAKWEAIKAKQKQQDRDGERFAMKRLMQSAAEVRKYGYKVTVESPLTGKVVTLGWGASLPLREEGEMKVKVGEVVES